MPYSYYEDLSGDDRSCCSEDLSSSAGSDDGNNDAEWLLMSNRKRRGGSAGRKNNVESLTRMKDGRELEEECGHGGEADGDDDDAVDDQRIIVHCDVDCFYCQCEAMDRNIPDDRPFAIGQKHIIVTCNYEARRTYGISKLQSRQEALRKCPSLLIVEGSDLERYRLHARKIYESFRRACKRLVVGNNNVDGGATSRSASAKIPVCKGSMDEMMADLSRVPVQRETTARATSTTTNDEREGVYVYGEQPEHAIALTEDQTGASALIVDAGRGGSGGGGGTAASRSTRVAGLGGPHRQLLSSRKQRAIRRRLDQAVDWALQIRETVLSETGFRTTLGLSVNPLLAKLASGLKKPGMVNILHPYDSEDVLGGMPLRKIPGLGHRTSKALEPCLRAAWRARQSHGLGPDTAIPPFWTCRYVV